MVNLRLVETKVIDSTTIKSRFTENLDSLLNTSNVEITSTTAGIPDGTVLEVKIVDDVLIITTRPLTPYATYYLKFLTTDLAAFKSVNGSFLFEDGQTNRVLILGAEDPANEVRDTLVGYLKDNVYGLENGSVARDIVNAYANDLSQALHDIGQIKNDNYLKVDVVDELHTRGSGPYDRLREEGAYEILRVGKRLTGASATLSLPFSTFPSGRITLQATSVTDEQLVAGTGAETFNGLTLTLGNNFVTKINAIRVAYQNGDSGVYNIPAFGYQLLDPVYDDDYASPYLLLQNNQVRLSDAVLDSDFMMPKAGDFLYVDYEYKNRGRVIDDESVTVTQILQSVREVTPASQTQFSLGHAPIVNFIGVEISSGGVTFLDPSANPPFSAVHPAFLTELPLSFDRFPARKGEYAIDYETGKVYVYGALTNTGTGDYPPVATYYYRKLYSEKLDYTYDPDLQEVVANPLRDLIGQVATINFSYENVLVPGVDYKEQIHQEVLDERIGNKLLTTGTLQTANFPVTNVFRIFNETTGEIYKITRWNGDKIYFSSSLAPRILDSSGERVTFADVTNELLITNAELVNFYNVKVFKILLENNRIMSTTEDVIGSSYNSSATFSRTDIFEKEIYFDLYFLTESENIDRLTAGQYQIDYRNGIIYLAVNNAQSFDLGTINYKKFEITPNNPHVTSVSEIYHSVDGLNVNKRLPYASFGENKIIASTVDYSDERFSNGDETLPYVVSSGTITVTDNIKNIRCIFDVDNLNGFEEPTNFAAGATFAGNLITLGPGIEKNETLVIQSGNVLNATVLTPGAEIVGVTNVIRLSDGIDLWTTPGSFSGYDITLTAGSPGEVVLVTYDVQLNGAATPVVDYNRGDYFVDYSYLADEILVSYEYGDNVLDFRESNTLNAGEQYYVTYKAGALRDALLKNFGGLVNLPILNTFDTSLSRESYRDALRGALQSFPKGPTIPAIKSIVSNITHIEPEIEESAFKTWSLGQSRLYLSEIATTGDIDLTVGKFDYGASIREAGQTIKFPVSSNLRLEEGTLETWVIPEWNGIDNDATLTISLAKDGQPLDASQIFIGADSHHPILNDDGSFTINRTDVQSPIGFPSAILISTGAFIYYDEDHNQWKFYARDTTSYHVYSGLIQSSGEVYHVKHIPGLGELSDIIQSSVKSIKFELHLDGYDVLSPDGYVDGYDGIIDGYWDDGYLPGTGYVPGYSFDGIQFMADEEHYIFDFGATDTTNRFSLFKDGRGYLVFQVYDNGKIGKTRQYKVSKDISDWRAGQKHHVAVSWRLNSYDRRDELHLFVDGIEVPNILKYGGRPAGTSADRFRTVKPEFVVGPIPAKVIAGNDLVTQQGSPVVLSTRYNLQNLGIAPGHTLTIDELGFNTYIILSVNGSAVTLDSNMPATVPSNGKYSINRYSVLVDSEIDLYNNIAVSIIHDGVETEIPGLRAEIPGYAVSKDSLNRNVLTILGNADAGDHIAIRTLGQNHRRCRDTQYVWGNSNSIIRTQLPPPVNLDEAIIRAVVLPLTPIGPSNATYSLGQFQATLSATQPTNATEGRKLNVRVSAGNVNFGPGVTVRINGTTAAGPVFENVVFTGATNQPTVNKFKTISSVDVTCTPLVSTRNSVSVEIKELNSITVSEGNNDYPVLRFAYKTQIGTEASGSIGGNVFTDTNGYFVQSMVKQKIVVTSPPAVAGTYTVEEYLDDTSVRISPALPATFTNGSYGVFNISIGRSGFQNGYFVLEKAGTANTPYLLPQGWYEFDYSSYLSIPFDPVNGLMAYVGSDRNGSKQAKAVLDEFRILSKRLTDVRVGEVQTSNDSVTSDSIALRAFAPNSSTLMLLHFDTKPFVNSADYWVAANKSFMQASESVNTNFTQSLVLTEQPLVVENEGLLTTSSEGSVEFWISPRYDTYNDPEERYYFDSTGAVVEETLSISAGVVRLEGRVSEIISIKLLVDDSETGLDYFTGGSIAADFQTISLGRPLPSQKTQVKITYIPSGLAGDRISIYKDAEGYVVFRVRASGNDFMVRQPVFWQRDSWHRVMATFKFNRLDNRDEMRLFIDGEEKGMITFGSGLLFGQNYVFGQGFESLSSGKLTANIDFSDTLNEFYVGSDFRRRHKANARMDNLRVSNIARRPLTVAGQAKDVNYSSNLEMVYPVVTDGFTTYLLDFDSLIVKADDFALLKNENYGIFDFALKIIDSFGIVAGSAKVKQVLESLIAALKPAQSKVQISYHR